MPAIDLLDPTSEDETTLRNLIGSAGTAPVSRCPCCGAASLAPEGHVSEPTAELAAT